MSPRMHTTTHFQVAACLFSPGRKPQGVGAGAASPVLTKMIDRILGRGARATQRTSRYDLSAKSGLPGLPSEPIIQEPSRDPYDQTEMDQTHARPRVFASPSSRSMHDSWYIAPKYHMGSEFVMSSPSGLGSCHSSARCSLDKSSRLLSTERFNTSARIDFSAAPTNRYSYNRVVVTRKRLHIREGYSHEQQRCR